MSWRAVVDGPAELVRGYAVLLTVSVLGAGDAVITPTGWTATLRRGGATVATRTGSGAVSWSLAAGADWALADDYAIEWSITAAGVSAPTAQAALVCRRALQPPLRLSDVYAADQRLDPESAEPVIRDAEALVTWLGGRRDAAWRMILQTLRSRGQRPQLILDGYDLHAVHLAQTLALVYRGLVSSLGAEYLALAEAQDAALRSAWSSVTLTYAPAESTDATGATRHGADGPIFAGGSWGQTRTLRHPPASIPHGMRTSGRRR